MRRSTLLPLALLLVALALAGCSADSVGGAPSVADAQACLKDELEGAEIEMTTDKDEDKQVVEGVFATNGVGGAGSGAAAAAEDDFVMAIAAEVRKESTVEEFEKDTKAFTETLDQGGKERLTVKSGTDGNYVWVVAGATGAEEFDAAIGCVKP